MATATLVVAILGFGGLAWLIVDVYQTLERDAKERHLQQWTYIASRFDEIRDLCLKTADVLTEASRIKAIRQDSVFDRDTITPTNQKPRYVSLAIRRAQAERASLGPVTHDDRVRENNARAIESAG